MYHLLLTLCGFALLFIATARGQEKKTDVPDPLDEIGKRFAEAKVHLEIGMLELKKGPLQMKLDGYRHARFVLKSWKKLAEKEWPKLKKEEKDQFQLYFERTQNFAKILGPKKMTEEVIPVAAAAFAGRKITKPTKLQEKIMALPSKEKDEAKRIVLTIRECLRYTAEDDASLKKEAAQIDQQISKLRKLLPEPKKGEKKTKKK